VRVGLDGIALRRLGTTRTLELATLGDVYTLERGRRLDLVIEANTVDPIVVHATRSARSTLDALVETIRRHRASAVAVPGELDVTRAPAETVAARLIALRGHATSYRDAGPDRETLWRVVGAAGVPASVRIAAAAALGPEVADRDERFHAVVGALVDPDLRAAVESAARLTDPAHLAGLLDAFAPRPEFEERALRSAFTPRRHLSPWSASVFAIVYVVSAVCHWGSPGTEYLGYALAVVFGWFALRPAWGLRPQRTPRRRALRALRVTPH
jgi:hypothetical protein